MSGKPVDPDVPTWCEYCAKVHAKGAHTRRDAEPYWVSCSQECSFIVSQYRHLLPPGELTTICGCTASEREVWRRSTVKAECPDCMSLAYG